MQRICEQNLRKSTLSTTVSGLFQVTQNVGKVLAMIVALGPALAASAPPPPQHPAPIESPGPHGVLQGGGGVKGACTFSFLNLEARAFYSTNWVGGIALL